MRARRQATTTSRRSPATVCSGCRWPSRRLMGYLTGLGEMYVADPRFAGNYDKYGAGTAAFVHDAMAICAERNYG